MVFGTNKAYLFVGGTATADVRTADALFVPLIARRLVDAQSAASRAITNSIQLDVALAYMDLLQTYGELAVNAQLLALDREVVRRAEVAERTELAKTGADINRARTELLLRLQERTALRGQVRVTSSRLARLLLLRPSVGLLPADPVIVPLQLVPEECPVDNLVAEAVGNRPEMAEGRALISASEARLRQAQLEPVLPHFQVSYAAGGFGGGVNDDFRNFKGRGDATVSAFWELQNLGLGNLAEDRALRIQVNEATVHLLEIQARVADEVVQAFQIVQGRRDTLADAQAGGARGHRDVPQTGSNLLRHDRSPQGTGDRRADPGHPADGPGPLPVSRRDRGLQPRPVRLFTAVGQPALESAGKVRPQPVSVPVVPRQ